jgi:hypothetical protein
MKTLGLPLSKITWAWIGLACGYLLWAVVLLAFVLFVCEACIWAYRQVGWLGSVGVILVTVFVGLIVYGTERDQD